MASKIKITRIYTTKVNDLVKRKKIYEHGYPYEFLNKMIEKEIQIYLNEIKQQLYKANITPRNIYYYNKIIRGLIEEREDIYQTFKKNYVEDYSI
jgi:hypothetical protein